MTTTDYNPNDDPRMEKAASKEMHFYMGRDLPADARSTKPSSETTYSGRGLVDDPGDISYVKGHGFGQKNEIGTAYEFAPSGHPPKFTSDINKADKNGGEGLAVYLIVTNPFDASQPTDIGDINAIYKQANRDPITKVDLMNFQEDLYGYCSESSENGLLDGENDTCDWWVEHIEVLEDLGYDALLSTEGNGSIMPFKPKQIIHAKTGREMIDENIDYGQSPAPAMAMDI